VGRVRSAARELRSPEDLVVLTVTILEIIRCANGKLLPIDHMSINMVSAPNDDDQAAEDQDISSLQ
jgi:hypothetical protein